MREYMRKRRLLKLDVKTNRAYYKKNKMKLDPYRNAWNKKNPEIIKIRRLKYKDKKRRSNEQSRLHYKNYTEKNGRLKLNFSGNLYRARKRGHIHNFTYDEWLDKLNSTNGFCPCCKEEVGIDKLSMDHIIPTTKAPLGTIYLINDVRPLCCECNRIKWTNSDDELLTRLKKMILFLNNK